jgi:hypothetical protein
MPSILIRGVYTTGARHSALRPKFYKSLGTRQGTINVRVLTPVDPSVLLPNHRITGTDQIDIIHHQDFLVRECCLRGVKGYQVLPIDKTTGEPRGYHRLGVIEITLLKEISLADKELLEVELKFEPH